MLKMYALISSLFYFCMEMWLPVFYLFHIMRKERIISCMQCYCPYRESNQYPTLIAPSHVTPNLLSNVLAWTTANKGCAANPDKREHI